MIHVRRKRIFCCCQKKETPTRLIDTSEYMQRVKRFYFKKRSRYTSGCDFISLELEVKVTHRIVYRKSSGSRGASKSR